VKGFSIVLGSMLSVATPMAFAAGPDFKDYAVTPVFSGPNDEPVQQEQSNPVMDSTRAKALQGKVNFAGHYILYPVGCGGSTMCCEVLDARTGEVVGGLPNAYDGNALSLSNRPDSRLLIVSGIAADTEEDAQGNELESRYRTRYFEFVNNEFRLLTFKDL
jgi:hypothetical protein